MIQKLFEETEMVRLYESNSDGRMFIDNVLSTELMRHSKSQFGGKISERNENRIQKVAETLLGKHVTGKLNFFC